MGGYLPNPVSIGLAKAVAYSAFGWAVRLKASRPGNPLAFGALRVAAGWLVGLAVLLFALRSPGWSDRGIYAALLAPRFAVWALVIHWWFRPRGGTGALAMWSLLGTALSTVLDLIA